VSLGEKMKIALFITIVLVSGCFAGVIQGLANIAISGFGALAFYQLYKKLPKSKNCC